jgi:FMN-dependent oxidoreductase (nitrilotriacetate monooxygenase family)
MSMFHLGWFLGDSYGIHPWRGPWSGRAAQEWMKPGLYVDLATSLERAGFDFLFIEDTAMVEDTYRGSMETPLKYGLFTPKNDPLPLMPVMAGATRHLGIISTISTIQYPPYLAARMMTSLDHLTEGRAGINVVTSVTHRVAQNFGYDEHMEHDQRYEQAQEWMDVVSALWDSWEPGAYVGDTGTPMLVDHTKVHTIDHVGRYFKVRGPLNTMPGPQHRPVIGQAGNSIPGRDLAARHADTMLAWGRSVEQMQQFRADMRQRLMAAGRKPDDLKVMFLATPTIAETDAAARALDDDRRNHVASAEEIEIALWGLSYGSGGTVDFSQFDLDAPLPEVIGNGEQSSMKHLIAQHRGRTLRQAITGMSVASGLDLVGSPDTVAAKMDEIMSEVGGDGFLLYPEMNRRSIAEICDGLVPALRKRGVVRTGYDGATFRDNLLAY